MTSLIQKIGGPIGVGGRVSLVEMLIIMGGVTAAVFAVIQIMKYRNARPAKSQT